MMKATELKNEQIKDESVNSYKGTLFSTIVFVGGGIVIFTVILFVFYMTRL